MMFREMEGHQFSARWQTPVKKIVKSAVVICPAFRCKMGLLPDKKSRVFIVLLKFNYRKVVLPHERRKLLVELVASRARDTCVIIEVAT